MDVNIRKPCLFSCASFSSWRCFWQSMSEGIHESPHSYAFHYRINWLKWVTLWNLGFIILTYIKVHSCNKKTTKMFAPYFSSILPWLPISWWAVTPKVWSFSWNMLKLPMLTHFNSLYMPCFEPMNARFCGVLIYTFNAVSIDYVVSYPNGRYRWLLWPFVDHTDGRGPGHGLSWRTSEGSQVTCEWFTEGFRYMMWRYSTLQGCFREWWFPCIGLTYCLQRVSSSILGTWECWWMIVTSNHISMTHTVWPCMVVFDILVSIDILPIVSMTPKHDKER